MAVVVQEMVSGEKSGIVFGKSPTSDSEAVIEAVHGLNQGLVDGTIEPDRWILNRKTADIISHQPVPREKAMRPLREGVRIETLPPELSAKPPLDNDEVSHVFSLARKTESLFGAPQDVEWTYRNQILHTLQSRPITAASTSEEDRRPWYLNLHRSFDNLKSLWTVIENEHIPAMEQEAAHMVGEDLSGITDEELAEIIEERTRVHDHWHDIYWRDCIPFAHGMRLFGQVYNDVMEPDDPFEFIELLSGANMVSVQRNRMLEDLALKIRNNEALASCLRSKGLEDCDADFLQALDQVMSLYGDLTWEEGLFGQDPSQFVEFFLEMASNPPPAPASRLDGKEDLEARFLSKFESDQRDYARDMLTLGRASYRWRDDDNTYLGKIEGQVIKAVEEGRTRIAKRERMDTKNLKAEEVLEALRNKDYRPAGKEAENGKELKQADFRLQSRQIVGQPAGSGIAFGKARVVRGFSDLFQFKRGEILVCDSMDPNMTFIAPLAAGIVERRGGMLIYGAIIAREYGLPCVTGVAEAASAIKTGDTVTVDGHLGIVIIGEATLKDSGTGFQGDD